MFFFQITFWFPDTIPSSDAALSFARKLGERRCHIVGREFPSPSALLREKSRGTASSSGLSNVSKVLRSHSRPLGHEFITTFDALRQDVFLELAHFDEVEGEENATT